MSSREATPLEDIIRCKDCGLRYVYRDEVGLSPGSLLVKDHIPKRAAIYIALMIRTTIHVGLPGKSRSTGYAILSKITTISGEDDHR